MESRPEIDKVINLITLQLGSELMVAVKAKMVNVDTTDQLVENINKCEKDLKKEIPAVKWIFFEPDVKEELLVSNKFLVKNFSLSTFCLPLQFECGKI